MEPVPPALRRASSGAQHRRGLARGVRPPPPPQTLGFRSAGRGRAPSAVCRGFWEKGRQAEAVQAVRVRTAGYGTATEVSVAAHAARVQQQVRCMDPYGARADKPTPSYPWQALNPYGRSCSTASTSAREYLEFKYETSTVCYRDQPPANLTSSSMATAISTTNVFSPAIFPPAGIHEKFCITTNIKNTRARLDHFTGNRRHT